MELTPKEMLLLMGSLLAHKIVIRDDDDEIAALRQGNHLSDEEREKIMRDCDDLLVRLSTAAFLRNRRN